MTRYLEPGGFIEIVDIVFPIEAVDETMASDSALAKWSALMLEASKILRRPLNSAESCKELLGSIGFADIVESRYQWPQNRWPKEPKLKELGEFQFHNEWRNADYNRTVGS